MNGTWLAMVEIPDVPDALPELLTFSTSGTVVASTGFPPFPFDFDQGSVVAAPKIGQGNWVFRGGMFRGTQLRFLVDLSTYMPIGFTKLVSEWRLLDRNTARGSYRAEVLQPNMSPYTIGGVPVVFEDEFEMYRLPVESLP
jgi:hypothetical protein